jgi:hypothetical protein
MESVEYGVLRVQSSELFNNSLLLPVAVTIARETAVEGTLTASELRERLAGRAESNQIRDVVDRIGAIGAVQEMPRLKRPNPRLWIRLPHPFWAFVDGWAQHAMSTGADASEVAG